MTEKKEILWKDDYETDLDLRTVKSTLGFFEKYADRCLVSLLKNL